MVSWPKSIASLVVEKVAACPGVSAIVLGGSLATGAADADSDIDIGLYYQPHSPIDLRELSRLVSEVDDRRAEGLVTDFGEWGPWVNGGAWLVVQGLSVDLLYRDLGRVREAIADCRAGHVGTHYQAGHPAGFSPQIYAGEIHFCEPLYDPEAFISWLKELIFNYPPALQRALIAGLWEAGFSLEVAQSSARRGDVYHATGCAYRSVVCMVQALFGLNKRYWINEKGAVEEAEAFLRSPGDLGARVRRCLGEIGTGPEGLQRSLQELRLLLDDVERLVDGHDRR